MRAPVVSLLLLLLAVICGCGGSGGSGGSGGDPAPTTASASTKAVTTFGASLANAGTETFGSVEFTVDLPAGVTVPADSDGLINSSNLVLIDKALAVSTQVVLGSYVPASGAVPAKVHIAVITLNASGNGAGMLPGKFATLTCNIAQGSSVSAAVFAQPSNAVITDPTGAVIPAPNAQIGSVTILQ